MKQIIFPIEFQGMIKQLEIENELARFWNLHESCENKMKSPNAKVMHVNLILSKGQAIRSEKKMALLFEKFHMEL